MLCCPSHTDWFIPAHQGLPRSCRHFHCQQRRWPLEPRLLLAGTAVPALYLRFGKLEARPAFHAPTAPAEPYCAAYRMIAACQLPLGCTSPGCPLACLPRAHGIPGVPPPHTAPTGLIAVIMALMNMHQSFLMCTDHLTLPRAAACPIPTPTSSHPTSDVHHTRQHAPSPPQNMAPANASGAPSAALLAAINRDFGSLDALFAAFNTSAASRFGSGWAWVCVVPKTLTLAVTSTANQVSGGAVVVLWRVMCCVACCCCGQRVQHA